MGRRFREPQERDVASVSDRRKQVTFSIGARSIGDGARCFIIAEAGVNHNGEVGRAHELVELAAGGGADAVKFQTFDASAVVATTAPAAPYQSDRGATTQSEMLRELALPDSAWRELADHARERSLTFISTAFDRRSLELLLEIGIAVLKCPSGELDNIAFLADLASVGLPIIVSTGLGTEAEVSSAVEALSAAPAIALLHCVSAYPAPVSSSNLRAMQAMATTFKVPVGWSDHTPGHLTAIAAVAMGASILEKHITVDHALPGPDHSASLDAQEFDVYVDAVRGTEAALGDGVKRPTEAELENRFFVRRSYHASRALHIGDILAADDVVLLRPAAGIPASEQVVGRAVVRAVAAGAPVRHEDVA
jgi:N,N'-diacetyllegionaminate synthase